MADIFDVLFGPVPEDKPKAPTKPAFSRPSFVKRPSINVDQWFDVGDLWNHVMSVRKSVPAGARVEIPVVPITHPGLDEAAALGETAHFFGKDREILNIDTRVAWDRVMTPFLDDVEEALNAKKPKELHGRLRFDVGSDSSLTLFYIER